ncbi:hypothetical protein LWI28_017510 [Acer negundo]|uniref:Patatin n=1 Tax=Acer negundo TaxID=4023 RepID=A0AAD5J0U4_ACENE|nr:hypothetical protein LWI28_017510 [Acer negundo]
MKIYKPRTAEKLQTVTVLSIDGSGSRGIIPAVALHDLEKFLQDYDGDDNLRISDYFDVISGSGMGSIIAGMLTVPDDHQQKRPRYTMRQILDSLINEIFYTFRSTRYSWFCKIFGGRGHQETFKQIIRDKLKGAQLDQTLLSNVVIPVFNDKKKRPVILSSSQPKDHIQLSDAVLGSSAMPAFLDPLEIKCRGEDCIFIDGGLVSTNPTLFALQEADKLVSKTEPDYKNYLVLSLGTADRRGLPEVVLHMPSWLLGTFTNRIWRDWGPRILQYAYDTFSDITKTYMTLLLKCDGRGSENYLRIQGYREDFVTSITDETHRTFEALMKYAQVFLINPFVHSHPVPAITDGSSRSLGRLKSIGEPLMNNAFTYINPYTGKLHQQRYDQPNKIALQE